MTRRRRSPAKILEMPLSARREVVEDGQLLSRLRIEQSFGEMTADESGTPDDAGAALANCSAMAQRVSHRLPLARGWLSNGWLTSRCHTTAHRPSVCGVTRSG